jgi:hypothetical protein
MAFGMRLVFVEIIQSGSLKNTYVNGRKNGFEFDVRLAYYRGLYLSCIDKFEVVVDGEKIDSNDITFCLNDKEFSVYQLPHLISEFWTILTPANIKVRKPGGLPAGEHEIELTLILRSPYMPLPGGKGDHKYVPIDSCDKKILSIAEQG